jgi:hypothetical protein
VHIRISTFGVRFPEMHAYSIHFLTFFMRIRWKVLASSQLAAAFSPNPLRRSTPVVLS